VLPVLFKGGTVLVPQAFDSDDVLRLMERHRVTVGFGTPDLLDAVARSPLWPAVDLSSIRLILTGGAPVPARLLRTYFERGSLSSRATACPRPPRWSSYSTRRARSEGRDRRGSHRWIFPP
jgi:acyl-CoA synthetase (AMP-forming)/AMP-acid ligase II